MELIAAAGYSWMMLSLLDTDPARSAQNGRDVTATGQSRRADQQLAASLAPALAG